MNSRCDFCGLPAVIRVTGRSGYEEQACGNDAEIALRTCAEREYEGESLRVEFIDGTGIALDHAEDRLKAAESRIRELEGALVHAVQFALRALSQSGETDG